MDPTDFYLKHVVGKCKLLSREDEHALAVRMKQGDIEARNQLVQANLKWAVLLARKYGPKKVPYDDCIQIATVALIQALKKFDPERGIRITTFAALQIQWHFMRVRNTEQLVHAPNCRTEKYEQDYRRTFQPFVEIRENHRIQVDFVAEHIDRGDEIDSVRTCLALLPERECFVLESRMQDATLQSIADIIGVTRERVRQIEAEARKRLRGLLEERFGIAA